MIEERLTSLENAATCGSKPEELYIGADVSSATALDVVDEEECLAEPGLCKAIDTEELGALTAAQYQYIELHRIINSSFCKSLILLLT